MATSKIKTAEEPVEMTFEAAMSRLEEIVQLLENEKAPLEESLRLYEEGVSLVRRCSSELDGAEQKVQILQRATDGTIQAVDFDAE